jgi:hypothetical protein
MLYVLGIAKFPVSKAKKVSELWIKEAKENPPDRTISKPILRIGGRIVKDEVEAISLTEVKEGKYEEYLKNLTTGLLKYADIEGFKFRHKVYLSGVDTMPMIGLEMPE